MKEYKANWRYYFFLVLFSGVVLLGAKVIYMLLNGEVSDEDGQLSEAVSVLFATVIGIVLLTYLITAFNLLKQLIMFKSSALTITDNGIEHTLVYINLFAFVIVVPVKLIPWEAVTFFDDVDGHPYIRVSVKMVKCGLVAKLLLFVLGYSFCFPFVSPGVEMYDVEIYNYRFNIKN